MMDFEYSVILITLSILIAIIWPQMVRSYSKWKNKSLRKDNPHLNRCYYLRMWGAPFFVITTTIASILLLKPVPEHDILDKAIVSILILLLTMFIGTLLTEFLVDYYRKHESRFH